MTYDELLGDEYLFYGVDGHLLKLDDTVIEAIEDPWDGLRTALHGEPLIRGRGEGIFFREPVAIVRFCHDDQERCTGYSLWDDEHEHIWLRFGTDNSDPCYPLFYFQYEPLKDYTIKRKKPSIGYVEPNQIDRLFEERHS